MKSDTKKPVYLRRQRWEESSIWQKKVLLVEATGELTERCNFNCLHCYINQPAGDQRIKQKELTTAEWLDFLREVVELGCLTVRFTGGEPLLREDFAELYTFSRRLGLKVGLFTNGSLITSRLARLWAKIPPLEKIEITLYGLDANSYEKITRVKGSWEAVQQGIAYLKENRIPFIIKGAMLPPIIERLKEFKRKAQQLASMDFPPAMVFALDLRARRDSPEKNQEIVKLRLSPQEYTRLMAQEEELYYQTMNEFCSKFLGPPGTKLFTCEAGRGAVALDAYGQLQPCLLLRHPKTIYPWRTKRNLGQALKQLFPSLLQCEATNPAYLARCARCFLAGLCEQCPARSWMEHGSLDTPIDYYCRVTHEQARSLGLIKDKEKGWMVKDWPERLKRWQQAMATKLKKKGIIE